ncbi:hypothetical protein ACFLWA_12115 [Chloroflexota bacterium]
MSANRPYDTWSERFRQLRPDERITGLGDQGALLFANGQRWALSDGKIAI